MKRLVVNADDFGLTEGVNRAVLEAHRHGILTSATLLANGAAFDSAVTLALGAPRLGVGVHLNLTAGPPISDPALVASLVDTRGRFCGGPLRLLDRTLAGKLRPGEVERELEAQIEKVRRAGIEITHLDGHKHAHMLPGVFPIVARLARRHGIPGVRVAAERPTGLGGLLRRNAGSFAKILRQSLQARALTLLTMDCRRAAQQAGLAAPLNFIGITQTGFLDGAELEAILWNLPEGTSELMCHPGIADAALRKTGTRLQEQREREREALTRPETMKLLAALGIELINYRALTAAR